MPSTYHWGTSARTFSGNIILMPGCLSPRYQFQSSQRPNFPELRLNGMLCLRFSITTYSMCHDPTGQTPPAARNCHEYTHPSWNGPPREGSWVNLILLSYS